jgi:3-oxoacyl-[acyl-carrier protein] reductase
MQMDFGIAGKVALVSGGSRGIGRAAAEILAREGAKIVIAARNQDAIDDTVKAIQISGGEAVGVSCNMVTEEGVEAAVETAKSAFGSPDIAISNVHGPGQGDFADLTPADFAQAMDEIVLSVIHFSRAVVPAMQAKGWGRLVNIGSGAAKEPPPELKHILANTARAAVVTFNKSLSNELGKDGITVNTVGTGFIGTQRMWDYVGSVGSQQGVTAEEAMKGFSAGIPMRRPGKPEEIGAVIAFLCSEQAGYLTGQLIPVDGGVLRGAF